MNYITEIAAGQSFTYTGSDITATEVLSYIEITCEDDLKKYVRVENTAFSTASASGYYFLDSGYYKFTKSFDIAADHQIVISKDTNVVLDIAKGVEIKKSDDNLINVIGGNLTVQGEGTLECYTTTSGGSYAHYTIALIPNFTANNSNGKGAELKLSEDNI